MNRRQWLRLLPAALTGPACALAPSPHPLIRASDVLRFPHDFGAHPTFRTEWWYITGTLQAASPSTPTPFGFQITFFRSRVDAAERSHSRFAAKQLVFAHTALSDIDRGEMLHDQRIARVGFGLAQASEGDTGLTLRDWTLQRQGPADASFYTSHVAARDYTLDLRLTQTQALMLQGLAGFSQKGPQPLNASHYYSQPQLAVRGQLKYRQQTLAVQGRAWLDHEWSEALLDQDAVGWDWIGMNLRDGSALMAFSLRRRDGSSHWRGGSLRRPGQPSRALCPDEVRFTPGRLWTSPASAARYPVQWQLEIAGERYEVRARMDKQEIDSRRSTGGIYWEGLSDLLDAQGRIVGTGYLEMTGYAAAMTL